MLQTRYEGKRCVASDTDDNGIYRVTPLKWRYFMKRKRLAMNLQFFADSGNGEGNAGTGGNPAGQQGSQTGNQQIDYAKIQQMLEGTLAAKEDTALKAYFKQQGLSQEEAEQAMATFKAERAKNQPDVNAIQEQLINAQSEAQKSKVESAAILEAVGMGLDAKTIPYVLKMADLSQAVGQDGKINNETIKNALNKVIEDVPQLKPQPSNGAGFRQVGGPSGGGQNQTNDEELKRAFGLS